MLLLHCTGGRPALAGTTAGSRDQDNFARLFSPGHRVFDCRGLAREIHLGQQSARRAGQTIGFDPHAIVRFDTLEPRADVQTTRKALSDLPGSV